MVKEPRLGRVKTRLARDVGGVTATQFYRGAATAVLTRLAADPRWRTWLAVTPDVAVDTRFWPARHRRQCQGGGDVGQRMQRIMDRRVVGPVIIIGTDIPAITPGHIAAAFDELGRRDAVFGPTDDGGYWLVGFRRRPRVIEGFAHVRWSSEHALADTLANFAGHHVGRVATLRDIDDGRDLDMVRAWSGRRILPMGARSVSAIGSCPSA